MKRLLIFLFTISTFSVLHAQTDNALARVEKNNTKLVFFYNEPINDYEQAFTFENKIENLYCLTPNEVFAATIKNANIEAANQSKLYDAIILNPAGRDMAIIWKDKSKDNAIARVKKVEGKFIFVQCEPISNYNMVGKYNVSGAGQQVILGTCPPFQEKISKLIKKANKENEDFDGVMYGSEEQESFKTIEKSFFSKKGKWSMFTRSSASESTLPANLGIKNWKVYQVSISKNELRKYLEEQKIIKSLTNGF